MKSEAEYLRQRNAELEGALRDLMRITAAVYAHHVNEVPEYVQARRVLNSEQASKSRN